MPPWIDADEIDGLHRRFRQSRSGTDTAGYLNGAVLAYRLTRFEQCPGNVLRNYPLLVFPAFDVWARDVCLEVLTMMVLGVPRARRLMKPTQPKHGFGNKFESHLKAFEIALVRRNVVLAEDPELMFSNDKNHVCVDPGVGIAGVRLPGPVKCFRGEKDFEFTGRVIVLREGRVCAEQARGEAKQGYSQALIGHSKNSSIMWTHAPVFNGVIDCE